MCAPVFGGALLGFCQLLSHSVGPVGSASCAEAGASRTAATSNQQLLLLCAAVRDCRRQTPKVVATTPGCV